MWRDNRCVWSQTLTIPMLWQQGRFECSWSRDWTGHGRHNDVSNLHNFAPTPVTSFFRFYVISLKGQEKNIYTNAKTLRMSPITSDRVLVLLTLCLCLSPDRQLVNVDHCTTTSRKTVQDTMLFSLRQCCLATRTPMSMRRKKKVWTR